MLEGLVKKTRQGPERKLPLKNRAALGWEDM